MPNPTQFELLLAFLRRIAIATMPQVVSVVVGISILSYVPIKGTKQEKLIWSFGLLLFLAANYVDIGTGYHYYIPAEWEGVPVVAALRDPLGRKAVLDAYLMSAGVDTLFSEMLGAFFWGLLFEIYPDAFKQWDKVRGQKESISEMVTRQGRDGKKGGARYAGVHKPANQPQQSQPPAQSRPRENRQGR
jgi:hypothetical protein